MLVTNVQIRDTRTDTRLEAVTSVTFDDMLVVHDIKVINGEENCFLAMPSRRVPNGSFKDVAHPISKEVRNALERIIIDAFMRMRENGYSGITLTLIPGCMKKSLYEQDITDFALRDAHEQSFASSK